MDFLDFIPLNIFQIVGTFAGLAACGVISIQVIAEWRDKKPSSLALPYVIGWLLVFIFWFLYGIRFRAIALWLPNSIAMGLQMSLLIAVLKKRDKSAK